MSHIYGVSVDVLIGNKVSEAAEEPMKEIDWHEIIDDLEKVVKKISKEIKL